MGRPRRHDGRVPELPEVEHARRLVERVGRGRRIVRVERADDPRVMPDGPARTAEALEGRCVDAVRRHGKWLWLVLDERPHVLFHLGMTGGFRARSVAPLVLQTGPHGGERAWPPRFAKLTLGLDDGEDLVFTNARRLGRALVRAEPEREPPLAELGFDPLLALPSEADLRARLGPRRGTLKGLLLDQTFAAGVGNWVADEVLYQAGLDPRRPVGSLSDAEVSRLRATLGEVVRRAVEVDADAARYPASWLFHHRWARGTRTARGDAVEHLTVAGRTTAWVPARQR